MVAIGEWSLRRGRRYPTSRRCDDETGDACEGDREDGLVGWGWWGEERKWQRGTLVFGRLSVVEPVMERASCVSTSPILGAHLVSSLFPFTVPVGLYPKSNE